MDSRMSGLIKAVEPKPEAKFHQVLVGGAAEGDARSESLHGL